ncbi:MAG: sulfite exporter TauE/SafE family protein [Kiritimatiellaceae bacterium]|nr:sulfite exporter TauE/SafE family protein [Kiritimatiellaceae bacterium]
MSLITVILSGCVLGAAAVVQGSVGFGYALLATPLLVWLGIPLQQVIVMVAVGSLIQSFFGVRCLYASIPWRQAWIATGLRVVWLLAGLLILKKLITLDSRYIRFTVGAIICLLVGIQAVWKPKPVDKIHWGYTATAFSASGLLAGMVGMGGPPLVLWVMAHDWPPEKIRGFYFATFLTFIPIMIGMMFVLPGFGPLWMSVLTGLAFAPVIYCGGRIGLALGHRMSRKRLYCLTCVCLLATGISAMVSSL